MTPTGSNDGALRALGMPVPDSTFACAARELIEDVEPAFLVNHSIRAYAWAVELARHDGLRRLRKGPSRASRAGRGPRARGVS